MRSPPAPSPGRALLVAVVALAALAGTARATPVLRLGHHGAVRLHHARHVPDVEIAPGPTRPTPPRRATVAPRAHAARHRRRRTVGSELRRIYHSGRLSRHDARGYLHDYRAAKRALARLSGTRHVELRSVLDNLRDMAARGRVTRSRLPALFLTLNANRRWWTTGPLLSDRQRVSMQGSQLVWEYYAGQGIQLQMLGSFGKANGFWKAHENRKLRKLVSELVPLASHRRHSGMAWEYEFRFDGGVPPWTSAISQGTAVQVLARAAKRLDEPSLLGLAHRALGIFETPPPRGVRLAEGPGRAFYLIYSFAPHLRVLNAFIQSLIGLYDYHQISADPVAQQLFAAGDAEARRVTPAYDTGAWSLYALPQGVESTLSYHELVTTFLKRLCQRTRTPVYCVQAQRFDADLHTPPVLTLKTRRVRAGSDALLRFTLSKHSDMHLTVRDPAGRVVFQAGSDLPYGAHGFLWHVPRRRGRYRVTLTGTGEAGNHGAGAGTVRVR